MNKFLVTIYLGELDEAFWKLIPDHRERINELTLQNVIETYAVNLERTKGWIVMNANDDAGVIAQVEELPISDYFTYEIDQLFIFDNALAHFQKFVLN